MIEFILQLLKLEWRILASSYKWSKQNIKNGLNCRQKKHFFYLIFILSGDLKITREVNITVADQNDNSPKFTEPLFAAGM